MHLNDSFKRSSKTNIFSNSDVIVDLRRRARELLLTEQSTTQSQGGRWMRLIIVCLN